MNNLPFYTESGSGQTAVFLLHGVGGGHRAFDTTLPSLAQAGYRAIAWDAPGYGASDSSKPLGMGVFADALLQLVNHIGAKHSVVVGHSMGGMIAQEACFRQPSRLDGLVLFATSAAFGKPGGDWQKEFLQSRFAALDAGLGMAGLAPVLVGGMLALGASPETRGAVRRPSAEEPGSAPQNSTERQAFAAFPGSIAFVTSQRTYGPRSRENCFMKATASSNSSLVNAFRLSDLIVGRMSA